MQNFAKFWCFVGHLIFEGVETFIRFTPATKCFSKCFRISQSFHKFIVFRKIVPAAFYACLNDRQEYIALNVLIYFLNINFYNIFPAIFW